MKILVTGANGFIGKYVCDVLDTEHTVIRVDRFANNHTMQYNIDIFADDFDIFKFGEVDAVLHLAWKDGFQHNSEAHIRELSKHFNFCKKVVDCGIQQLAVMGSMHEIGYWEGAITENTPCYPLNLYGVAKNSLRQALTIYAQDKRTVIQWLRGFYIISDDRRSNSVFGKIARAADSGLKTFPFTSGRNKYDFLSVEQLAMQIAACITQSEFDGIINCCSGEPISLGDKAEQFIKENGFDISLDYCAFPERPYDSPCVFGDSSKIKLIMERK